MSPVNGDCCEDPQLLVDAALDDFKDMQWVLSSNPRPGWVKLGECSSLLFSIFIIEPKISIASTSVYLRGRAFAITSDL